MSHSKLETLLTEVVSLTYPDLKARYQEIFRRPPPPRLSQDLLRRAIAYQIQAQRLGGVSAKTEKLLKVATSPRAQNARRKLETGSQLMREWHGEMHVVEIIDGGFRWREDRFTSLSAVAREITGTRWSGPRFFGLTSNGSK